MPNEQGNYPPAEPVFQTRVIWGYFTYPFREDGVISLKEKGIDTRIGESEIPTLTSLSSLRARATKIVKACPKMQEFLLSHIRSSLAFKEMSILASVDATALFNYRYSGDGGEWADWLQPASLKEAPESHVTSHWKWVEKRDWHRTYSGSITSPARELLDIPDLRAYYACIYEGEVT